MTHDEREGATNAAIACHDLGANKSICDKAMVESV